MIDYLKQIKNIREDKDLTTTQMGNLLGMSHQNYTRIENGQQRLSVDTFIKILCRKVVTLDGNTKLLKTLK